MWKIKVLISTLVVFTFLTSMSIASQYCATPPFLTSSIPPNILLVVDVSGSMSWAAYYKTWSSTNSPADIGEYDPNITYEGYFIPDKLYELQGGVWKESSASSESCTMNLISYYSNYYSSYYNYYSISGICSGNRLNFARMSRMDLLRWALTGGKPSACPDNDFTNQNCDPDLVCTGSTCQLKTNGLYNGSWVWTEDVVEVPKERIKGVLQEMEELKVRPRFGALFYSNPIRNEKIYIGDYPDIGSGPQNADSSHPYTYLMRFINAISPGGSTATAPAMWEAYDYFAQENDHNYANGFDIAPGTFKDPMYFCDYEKNNCQKVPCAKNFAILVSDGQWNRGGYPIQGTCTIETGYENKSADPVVPAYRMHHDILRTLDGRSIRVKSIYALGLFMGGTGEQSLKNVAMYGSFDLNLDDNGNPQREWPGGVDASQPQWNGSGRAYPWDTCYMDDCGSGRGSACTDLPPSHPDWDKNGDGVPDTFFNAQNAQEIKTSLLKFLMDILKKTSAGTSVSAVSQEGRHGKVLVQAVFYPEIDTGNATLNWAGFINTFWLYNTPSVTNIREDSYLASGNVGNKILDKCAAGSPGGDRILNFEVDNATGDLKIKAFSSACNGTESSSTPDKIYNHLNSINLSSTDTPIKIWEAGLQLSQKNYSSRQIYTNALLGTSPSVPIDLISTANSTLSDLSTDSSLLGDDDGDNLIDEAGEGWRGVTFEASGLSLGNLIDYIYGKDVSGWRFRSINATTTWKLGDIVYSTPLLVDYKKYSVIFVGANDGMLHAFRMGKQRLDGIDPSYQNARLCDDNDLASCSVNNLGEELWAFAPKNVLPYLRFLADPNYCHLYYVDLEPYLYQVDQNNDGITDKLILIGGMRLGGAVGCSNSTDCIKPPEDTCPDPSSSSCVGLSSYFALDVTDPEKPKFLWEFSDPDLGFSYSGPAIITINSIPYVFFLTGPTNYDGKAGLPLNAFVLKLKNDFTIDNTYKINLSSKLSGITAQAFGSRLFMKGIDLNGDGNTDFLPFGITFWDGSTWKGAIAYAYTKNDPDPKNWEFDILKDNLGPITAPVIYGKCNGQNWLYYGTGRWFYKEDPSSSGQEKIGGLTFICSASSCSISNDWHIDLNNSETSNGINYGKERSITPAVTFKDVAIFTTFQPTVDICGYGGRSRMWAVTCDSGGNITKDYQATILLQLSRGNIEKVTLNQNIFTQQGNRATNWFTGTPPESSPLLVKPNTLEGKILYWLER